MSIAMPESFVIRAADQPLKHGEKSPLVTKRLLSKETFAGAIGVTWIKLEGTHAPQNSGTGERFYYILSGTVEFRIDGHAPEQAQAGDIVYMPKNVMYTFEGDITYLYVNIPA
jgi:ethanolamine utilization protein EutQ (cupin superfamily)